jgi:hypothetical protein
MRPEDLKLFELIRTDARGGHTLPQEQQAKSKICGKDFFDAQLIYSGSHSESRYSSRLRTFFS